MTTAVEHGWALWRRQCFAGVWWQVLAPFGCGVLCVLAFAPFELRFVAPLAIGAMHGLALRDARAGVASVRGQASAGLCFGLGLALAGCHWIFLGIELGAPRAPVLALMMTTVFYILFALFYAMAFALAAVAAQCRVSAPAYYVLVFPAAWTLLEWLRSVWFGGFPWLSLGDSQLPNGALAGYTPVGGTYFVTFLIVASAGLLAWCLRCAWSRHTRHATLAACALGAVSAGGWGLQPIDWTEADGRPLAAVLLQTSFTAGQKWDAPAVHHTLRRLLDTVRTSNDAVVVTPEVALPGPLQTLPRSFWAELDQQIKYTGSYLLVGTLYYDGSDVRRPSNAILRMGPHGTDLYLKQHLLPFGEYLPLKHELQWLYRDVFRYPMGEFVAGRPELGQALFAAGALFAPSICFEVAFGGRVAAAAQHAHVLLNIGDESWFDHGLFAAQSLQLAQARAAETGRPLLRANNVGVTAVIDHHGYVRSRLAQHEETVLRATIQGRRGRTPFMVTGHALAVGGALAALCVGALLLYRSRPRGPATSDRSARDA